MFSSSKALFRKAGAGGGGTTDPSFAYVPLLLNTGSTNGQNNQGTTTTNGFLDSSTNNFTITRSGTPTQGSFTPYWPNGQWSNYFSVATNYINVAASASLASNTSSFTLEFWYNSTATGNGRPAGSGGSGFVTNTWICASNNTAGKLEFFVFNYSAALPMFSSTSSTVASDGAWHHIVLVRSTNTWAMFIDGTRQGSSVTSSASFNGTSSGLYIGYSGLTGETANSFSGYISNFRFVNGSAQYDPTQTTITVPNSPLTPVTNTAILTCQSNRFLDTNTQVAAKTITVNGAPRVQAFQPFSPAASYTTALYGGSGYFNGSDAYLTYNQTFALGTNDFTLEFWLNIPVDVAYPTNYWLWGWRNGTNNCPALYLAGVSGGGNTLVFTGGASSFLSNPNAIPTNTWTHVAIVRSGLGTNNLKMYINGVQVAQSSTTQSFTYTGTQPVGANPSGDGGLYPSNVYFSNFRIVNGTAVYTAAFTPPTSPLTAITNTALLLNFTNAGIYDAAAQNVITTVGDAQVSTAITAKWPPTSIRFDGTGDYLNVSAGSPQSLTFGTGDFTIEFWVYFTSNTGQQCLYDGRVAAGAYPLLYTNAGVITYYVGGAPAITSIQPSTGVWYFMSLIRSSGTTRFFINGTQSGGSYTDSTNYLAPPTSGARVGANFVGGDFLFGYIQDFRVTKGVARAATPIPTAAFPTR